ncbi:MAG: FAD-binding oxidoreductase [Nitrososphaerota archaeon]|nr:FAD-binding oxidoreductase [Nitrososphaerota archaeon]
MDEPDKIVEELEGVLPGRVTRDVKPYLKDWWPLTWISDEPLGSAIAAAKPTNVDQVAALVKFAASQKVPLYIHGGGSSVTGASIPSKGIVVDMQGMSQILDLDTDNKTVTVQGGVKLKQVEAKLGAQGFSLFQFPQSLELVTVGGYISTLGTGQYSSLYGGIEDTVLRLEVVLPTGEVVWTRKRGAPRSSVGPDLSKLFLGAEGSFGIITAAELKIHPLPKHTWKAAYTLGNFEAGVAVAKQLMGLDVKPAVCRLYNEVESAMQFQGPTPLLLLIYHANSAKVLEEVKEEVSALLSGSASAMDATLVDRWLEKRFNFREDIENVKKMGYTLETIEVASKWSRIVEMYVDVMNTLGDIQGVAGVGAHLSHIYDQGACLYLTILFEPNTDIYWSIWEAMAKITSTHDATISHHHGVGILKRAYARDEVPMGLIKKIKRALDPDGTLSPDRLP